MKFLIKNLIQKQMYCNNPLFPHFTESTIYPSKASQIRMEFSQSNEAGFRLSNPIRQALYDNT